MSNEHNTQESGDYHIRIEGHLGAQWTAWFDGLTITHEPSGRTLLSGPLADQAALYGIIGRLRDIGVPLVSINRIDHPIIPTRRTMMKAVLQTRYGAAKDVLEVTEIVTPSPADNEVLIKIHNTTVETTDTIFRGGKVFSARMFTGVRKPKFTQPGGEFAGVVVEVGKDVTRFKPGDRVLGSSVETFGAHAEYIALPEDGVIAHIPSDMTDVEAVSIHPAGLTALPNLREAANLQPGQKILIIGASGSIGSSAVQLARYFGAEVTGVCSTRNVELVKSLGADFVIDYTQEDYTQSGKTYDVVFDTVGKSSFGKAKRVLKPGGRYLTTVISPAILRQMMWTSKFGNKKAQIVFAGLRPNDAKNEDIQFFLKLFAEGQLKAVIDRCYPLEQIAEAHTYVETGHKTGSVVIQVNHQ